MPVYTQAIEIAAGVAQVERCLIDPALMRRWLNPLLGCEALGSPTGQLGSRYRFFLRLPLVSPSLDCVIAERAEGLVQWQFEGFFSGHRPLGMLPPAAGNAIGKPL